jgi:hypothetical protein
MDPVDARVGLCATCLFRRIVAGARSTFSLCERSISDPRFPRYPPLPVVRCEGYVASAGAAADPEKTQ